MFTLYSDPAYLAPGAPHVPILVPFWGKTPELPDDPTRGRYDVYAATGPELLAMGTLEECDAAVFPQSWGSVIGDEAAEARAAAFVAAAHDAGKPAVIFFWNDSAAPVGLDATVFRTSLYRSRRLLREFAQPAWSEDFVERHLGGKLAIRKLGPRPVVGFCGYAPPERAAATTSTNWPSRETAPLRRPRGHACAGASVTPSGVSKRGAARTRQGSCEPRRSRC